MSYRAVLLAGAHMKEIPLTQGKTALVDDEDFEYLNQFKWCVLTQNDRNYAHRTPPRVNGYTTTIKMHSIIINTPKGMDTDHINGNGLDNRKENLRVATRRENLQNQKIHRQGHIIGVTKKNKLKTNPFMAQITFNGKRIFLGYYPTPENANRVYNLACWLYDDKQCF
jgi:hypothetical protein